MTTALLSNDTELLQRARRVLMGKGFEDDKDWNDNNKSLPCLSVYPENDIMFLYDEYCIVGEYTAIHLTPENFDSVMEGLKV